MVSLNNSIYACLQTDVSNIVQIKKDVQILDLNFWVFVNSKLKFNIFRIQVSVLVHSSLLRTFSLNATSTYDS